MRKTALKQLCGRYLDFKMNSVAQTSLDILLAEDNADEVFLVRQALKKSGQTARLHAVCDGLETVAYLNGVSAYTDRASYPFPDVLLLDLNMPRMNGFEVIEWVRNESDCRQLMIHVLSASCRESDVQRA